MDQAGVDRVVIVPPSWEGERNDYALEAAKKFPSRFGVMGRILLNDPQAPGRLATWKQQPGMLGVRHTFNGAQTNWLTDGTADWFWPAAAKAGIPVMTPTSGRAGEFQKIVRAQSGTDFHHRPHGPVRGHGDEGNAPAGSGGRPSRSRSIRTSV